MNKNKLMNKNFLLLLQGQLISSVGTQLYSAAIMFWTIQITGSASIMSTILMVSMLPSIIIGPFAGVFADIHSRRKIMIITDLINGLLILSIVGLIFIIPNQRKVLIFCLFLVSVSVGILGTFFEPAVAAAIPDIVSTDNLEKANSLYTFSSPFSQVIGQFAGGMIYGFLGAPILFFLNGLSYLYASISEIFIVIPQKVRSRKSITIREKVTSIKHDMIDGLKFIKHTEGMIVMFLVAMLYNFCSWPFFTLLPFYVRQKVGVGIQWYSYFMGALGLGSIIAFIFMGVVKFSGINRRNIMMLSIYVQAITLSSIAFIKNPILLVVVASIYGISYAVYIVNNTTVLQITTPVDLRGRVFGLITTFTNALTPIAIGLAGFAAELVNKNVIYIYYPLSILLIIIAVIVTFNGNFKKYLSK